MKTKSGMLRIGQMVTARVRRVISGGERASKEGGLREKVYGVLPGVKD